MRTKIQIVFVIFAIGINKCFTLSTVQYENVTDKIFTTTDTSITSTKIQSTVQYKFLEFKGSNGNISASNFITNPASIHQFEWKIQVPKAERLLIKIKEIHIPSLNGLCSFGYVDIGTYTASSTKEVKISHVCGNDSFIEFLAESNVGWVYVLYLPKGSNSFKEEFLRIEYAAVPMIVMETEFPDENKKELFLLVLILTIPLATFIILFHKWWNRQQSNRIPRPVDRTSRRFVSKHLYIDREPKKSAKKKTVKIKVSSPSGNSIEEKSIKENFPDGRKVTVPSGDYNNSQMENGYGPPPFYVNRLLKQSPHFPNYSLASSDTVFFHNTPDEFLKGRPSQSNRFLTLPEKSRSRPSSCISYLALEAVPETEVLNSCSKQPNLLPQLSSQQHFPQLTATEPPGQMPFVYVQNPEAIRRTYSMPYPPSNSYFRPIEPPEYSGRTMSMSGRPLKKLGSFRPMMKTIPGGRIGRYMSENIPSKTQTTFVQPNENSWKSAQSSATSSHFQSSGSYGTCHPTDSDRYATACDDSSIADSSAQVQFHNVDVRVEPRRASICTSSLEQLADRDVSTISHGLRRVKSISISQSSFHTYKHQQSQEVLTFASEDTAQGTVRAYTTQDLEMEIGSEMFTDHEKTMMKSMSPRSRRSLMYSTSHGLETPSYVVCDFTTQNGKTFHTNSLLADLQESDFPSQPLLDRNIISGIMEYDNPSFDNSGMLLGDSCYRHKTQTLDQIRNVEAVDINNNSQIHDNGDNFSEMIGESSHMVQLDEGESMV